MSEEMVSKGMLALRRNNNRPQKIAVEGEIFYFRKLTMDMEDELDAIVKQHQDPTLKEPSAPAAELPEGDRDNAWAVYAEALGEFRVRQAKAFRKLTAEIMKFALTDENGKALFLPDDDVYASLNNVYATLFFKAYTQFRQGGEVTPAAAEQKFQN